MRCFYFFSFCFIFCYLQVSPALCQGLINIKGTVYSKNTKGKKTPLEGAIVVCKILGVGTQSDEKGKFTLQIPDSIHVLFVSYVGYMTDTVSIDNGNTELKIELKDTYELKTVDVTERLKTTEVGLLNPMKVEKISRMELNKAACCNLSQSFETTPSIDVAFTDAVTGYRQIRMLGLAGTYTLITQENIPEIRGLASITGLSYTPGAWLEGMQLSKGTGSVVNGYESIAGQINVELKKPFAGEKWFLNLYQGSQGNSQADLIYRHNFSDNLGTVLFVDATSQWMKVDLNKDHFIDQPLGNQFNILNRWIYFGKNGLMIQGGIKVLYGQGVGGEWNYQQGMPQTPGNPWGYEFLTKRIEDWAKIAKVFTGREETSIGLQLSNIDHSQDSKYGLNSYKGLQNSFYANLIFQTIINNTNHVLKLGASEVLDIYNEQITQQTLQQNYYRTESVPGVFAEYTETFSEKLVLVGGLRADYDNLFGAFLTPRLHLRYAPFKRTAIRLIGGRAQRTANIFADNLGYMASNRQIDISNPLPGKPYGLNPEIAWNTGMNVTQKFKYRYHEGVFTIDYYYTQFQNQVVADINYPQILNFYNLQGLSFAHSFQAQFDYELIRKLNIRLAYRYNQVKTTYFDLGLQDKPFLSPHRAFANLDYETKNKWKFDYTIQWMSSERSPFATHSHSSSGSPEQNQSPSFFLMNAQITKEFTKKFEVYMGGENLTNYMQHDAIISPEDPFSRRFDASLIWGPMMGINVYAGLRYKF